MASTGSTPPGSRQSLAPARTYLAGAAMNMYYVAAIWLGMALLASVVSIRITVPAALAEIVIGALAAVRPHPRPHRQNQVHRAGDRRHPVRLRADPDRPAALPARSAGYRGRGSARRRGPLDRPPPPGAARPGAV